MALAANHLTTNNDGTDTSVYTTASIAPAPNALVLLMVSAKVLTGGATAAPTVAGNGLTWIEIDSQTFDDISTPTIRLTLFRAMGQAPTSGTVVMTFAATQTRCRWSILEFTGADQTGTNGSGAIVQDVKAVADSKTSPFSITLSAFSHTDNATYGCFEAKGSTLTAGSGFTLVSSTSAAAEYKLSNDTTVDVTFGSTPNIAGIAAEIKADQAIYQTLLTNDEDEDDLTIYTTASITPAADTLIILATSSRQTSGEVGTPTSVVGNGLTWVEIDTIPFGSISSPVDRLTIFRAMGSSPSSGTVVITWPAQVKRCKWSISEFTNVDTGGSNGANAIVQSANAAVDGGNSHTVTLSSFADSANATYGSLATPTTTVTVGTGFTQISVNITNGGLQTQWRVDNDTSVTWTHSLSGDVGGVAAEIRSDTALLGGGTSKAGTSGHLGIMF